MKGLRQYIRKHGRHFTEELAINATKGRWSKEDLIDKIESQVYYNVTDSTVGDIVFLVNFAKDSGRTLLKTRQQCIRFALCIVEEYGFHNGLIFSKWIKDTKDFDFTPYIC